MGVCACVVSRDLERFAKLPPVWAVTFIPMPMPKTFCTTYLYNKIVQLEVCKTCSGRGMGMNITAHCAQRSARFGHPWRPCILAGALLGLATAFICEEFTRLAETRLAQNTSNFLSIA